MNVLGEKVEDWAPPPAPKGAVMQGQYARLEPLDAEQHAALLFRAFEGHDARWDYMSYGPFHSAAQYHRWVRETVVAPGQVFYAIKDLDSGKFGGVASYLRINPAEGSIEVGNIQLSPDLAGSRAATEAMYLMMQWAFQAGYRRYEWKCNALNLPSRRAAQRLGFSYEGVFRQAMVVKGRNRDTAWFAAIDREWPALQEAFSAWLAPSNFDADGRQKERLSDLTRLVRAANDPTL
ncbi:GNAT family protein [Marinovum sp. 2_MG-2023]|uniref:GNAT family N-acetyltransferase n=1 Tax=unclassified Marinovum TaxID=2647166 RepID=UPI0026E1B483|nr:MULTISPECIES: GNAT family protein [unclassified Marinovum]MDO6729728.1 GNAT family protein [Marinovum sp. 2_MG-2023]MDO6779542.1 GNAT family protein [Marinovum sp. 1_MG-2023]